MYIIKTNKSINKELIFNIILLICFSNNQGISLTVKNSKMEREEITAPEEMDAQDMDDVNQEPMMDQKNSEEEISDVSGDEMPEAPAMGEGRQKVIDYISKRKGSPVEALTDDEIEELGDILSTDIEQLEQQDEVFRKLYETFDEFPEVKGFMSDLINTGSIRLAVARNFDSEDIQLQDGDDDEEQVKEALGSRMKAKKEYEKMNSEMKANMESSIQTVGEFVEAKQMGDDKANEFLQKIDDLLFDVAKSKLTMETLDMFYKGLMYDEDLIDAEQSGMVAGRVEQIEPEMMEDEEEMLPDIGSSGGKAPAQTQKRSQFADLADAYKEGRQM